MSQSDMLKNAASEDATEPGPTLRQRLRNVEAAYTRRSLLLIAPLLLFILISFVFPIASILGKSVANPELGAAMPETVTALARWDGHSLPDEATFSALTTDLRNARASGQIASVAKRMSYEDNRYRSLITGTLRNVSAAKGPVREGLIAAMPLWGEVATWQSVQRASRPFTSYYLLSAFDRKVDVNTGRIVTLPDDQALYVNVLLRTLWMATVVTLFCVGLGYPLA